MGLFDKIREPVILKENSQAELQLESLKKIEPNLNEEGKQLIKQDIRNIEYGIYGENAILYELKNSHFPIYVLRDIYLSYNDLTAQIDFFVFTSKIFIIIECKNLYGNIEVNNQGNFIRTIEYSGKWKKEGIYSPITQNQRHLELIKAKRIAAQTSKILKLTVEKNFYENYKSLVVLANPKTVLNMKYAKKEIKDQIIRVDQLVNRIKDMHNNSKAPKLSNAKLLEWAQSFLSIHQEMPMDQYLDKYNPYLKNDVEDHSNIILPSDQLTSLESKSLYKSLKEFRLLKSREEKIKPYYIFNNKQLEELIDFLPASPEELLKISGFGDVKVSKYGSEIIRIITDDKNTL